MPGMVMPGCSSTGADSGPSATELVLVLVLLLSLYVLGTAVWRHLHRTEIAAYSAVADGLGCAVHALGMIAMALLMLGTVRSVGPLRVYTAVFLMLAAVFLVRAWRGSPDARRDEVWRALVHASMAYMFWSDEMLATTAVCLALYLLYIGDHLRRSPLEAPAPGVARERMVAPSPHLVGTTGHLAIAVAMMLMLVLMQWPAVFG